MKSAMMPVAEAAERILSGAVLCVAGAHKALAQLPPGNWIGGSTVCFMTADGICEDRERVFVTEFDEARDARALVHEGEDLRDLAMTRFEGGLSLILIPAFSAAHRDFAIHGATYPGIFDQPLTGWIAGGPLDEIGRRAPAVWNGATGIMHEDGAALLHLRLAEGVQADIGLVNPFEPDATADEIRFAEAGFHAEFAQVNGRNVDFAVYLADRGIDTALPLVACHAGASVNLPFRGVDAEKGVDFFAPVVPGLSYRLARGPGDRAAGVGGRIHGGGPHEMTCSSIPNDHSGGCPADRDRTSATCTGPVTFGEIAYTLRNRTMVRLRLRAAESRAVA